MVDASVMSRVKCSVLCGVHFHGFVLSKNNAEVVLLFVDKGSASSFEMAILLFIDCARGETFSSLYYFSTSLVFEGSHQDGIFLSLKDKNLHSHRDIY